MLPAARAAGCGGVPSPRPLAGSSPPPASASLLPAWLGPPPPACGSPPAAASSAAPHPAAVEGEGEGEGGNGGWQAPNMQRVKRTLTFLWLPRFLLLRVFSPRLCF